jgi:hypothetical protein
VAAAAAAQPLLLADGLRERGGGLVGDGRDAERARDEAERRARAERAAESARLLAAAAASARARAADVESTRLAREYGVPGALYRDPSVFVGEAAEVEREEEDAERARARKASRRSFR